MQNRSHVRFTTRMPFCSRKGLPFPHVYFCQRLWMDPLKALTDCLSPFVLHRSLLTCSLWSDDSSLQSPGEQISYHLWLSTHLLLLKNPMRGKTNIHVFWRCIPYTCFLKRKPEVEMFIIFYLPIVTTGCIFFSCLLHYSTCTILIFFNATMFAKLNIQIETTSGNFLFSWLQPFP